VKTNSIIRFVGVLACVGVLQVAAVSAATESVLYRFRGGSTDGSLPEAGLINIGGTLYGTTSSGGAGGCASGGAGCGTVFKVNPTTGTETVVYSFCSQGGANCTDGDTPDASLIDVGGTLYGTTYGGGANLYGTVFKLTPSTDTEKVIHSFIGVNGADPVASLIDVGGTLYGTTSSTYSDFRYGPGLVIALTPNGTHWTHKVLHRFASYPSDGYSPGAGLINLNGILYGTTSNGGGGTVYKVNPTTGAEAVVYSFCSQTNCTDGEGPAASLIDVNGALYGTTELGGNNKYGTVFKVDPTTGAETVLHSFNGTDGAYPDARLIAINGALYGTTSDGGGTGCFGQGCGTVFKVNPTTGDETVVYSFCSQSNCTDGAFPGAGLIDVGGALYGTTVEGGVSGCILGGFGCGTVFKITP